ncbi:unnamed protein product [Arabis nemorensis]|uniref:Uncharacterized protein n=1 Tax=Arabis nemorensis TaxID=586526 RepID=A0A565BRY2_9BRAS|nr:unnamed protein product [Arabis nemorensis]
MGFGREKKTIPQSYKNIQRIDVVVIQSLCCRGENPKTALCQLTSISGGLRQFQVYDDEKWFDGGAIPDSYYEKKKSTTYHF